METEANKMAKQPSYRFEGYTEPWAEKKLGEILDYEQPNQYIVKSTEYSNSFTMPVLTAGQSFILGYTNEKDGIKKASRENPVIIFDDFTTASHLVDFDFKVKSSAMKILELKNDEDNIYLVYNILKNIYYTPQGHERHWISKFSDFNILIPNTTEQQAIGSFFQDIDQLISLQQRKLEVFKEQKKTYLKLLFPAKGQTKPALRFAGFEDDWKEVKLGDFVEISKGIQRNKEFLSPNADSKNCYPVYNGGKQESGYTDEFNREGNIMISEGGASAGFVNYFDGKYWSGGHNFTIDELENDIYYVLALLESQQQELYSLQVGSGLPNIQLNSLKKVIITFPAFLEQQAIGSFFQDLDKAIAKQEEKVNQLKESKQTLLRKMFI